MSISVDPVAVCQIVHERGGRPTRSICCTTDPSGPTTPCPAEQPLYERFQHDPAGYELFASSSDHRLMLSDVAIEDPAFDHVVNVKRSALVGAPTSRPASTASMATHHRTSSRLDVFFLKDQ